MTDDADFLENGAREFGDLLERVRAGSDAAAQELVDRYGQHILRVVRRRLNRIMRIQFDSVDFVQDVWASFFADRAAIPTFAHPNQALAYLVTMAANKVIEEYRRRCAGRKHNRQGEISLGMIPDERFHDDALSSNEPSPSDVFVAKETWQRVSAAQAEDKKRVLELLQQGLSRRQVAGEMGLSTKTVQRISRRIEDLRPQ